MGCMLLRLGIEWGDSFSLTPVSDLHELVDNSDAAKEVVQMVTSTAEGVVPPAQCLDEEDEWPL
ncbi:hypothetical protein Lal_00025191 [Lupinus albus]|uniref:Uncharacterized protein n=1 Tax=Lupinus albus TaxID=3870 RepID=A0A6A4PU99_LUPAL|nr:hypothetical protein Lalb_Chr10g0095431 [Lupinus albus]KAF1889862.1 hypothetical protein Lal_00025191 [Lupinus albus]